MRVGRKGALLLLAVVVLWAAAPALACLTPAANAECCRNMNMACCRGMHMRGHDSSAPAYCGDMCRLRRADAALLPGSDSTVDHAVCLAESAVPAAAVLPPASGCEAALPPDPSPPPDSAGEGSVLRI